MDYLLPRRFTYKPNKLGCIMFDHHVYTGVVIIKTHPPDLESTYWRIEVPGCDPWHEADYITAQRKARRLYKKHKRAMIRKNKITYASLSTA